ncbi:MAG: ribosome maturation factor RimM [Lachnospiraceae bacterium]|jgi:16S rRNA processing protein RimM|nr:ribosome maturation factor RimM [Lachnospiraceae bacterium]
MQDNLQDSLQDTLQVGVIASPHGLHGEAKVFPTTDDPARFAKLKSVMFAPPENMKISPVQEKPLQPVEVIRARVAGKFVIVKFAAIDRIEEIEKLKGTRLLIERKDALPLASNEYFTADLLGLRVITADDVLVGEISNVLRTGANDVYVVKNVGGEILLPAIRECILDVNIAAGFMRVHIMKGL